MKRGRVVLKAVIGTVVGGLLGYFIMYKLIGCATGTCPITRDPYISTAFGAVMGFLFSVGI